MITVTGRGRHWLKSDPVLLMLRNEQELEKVYRFFLTDGQGRINFISRSVFNYTEDVITGRYRTYEVKNEQPFIDGTYLELYIRAGKWDCYILPRGLPDKSTLEKSVFVTNKCITKTFRKD